MQSAESAERERPAGIPEGGFWNPSIGMWEVISGIVDRDGDGECLRYRSDGSLFSRSRFVAGVEEGAFTIYHPDGATAREGAFVAGQPEGLVVAYASEDQRGEPLRACCVPPTAARLEAKYRNGQLIEETFFNHAGRVLLSDGRPRPPRPPLLEEAARFDESRGVWVVRSERVDRLFSNEGALVEEHERTDDGGRVVRTFAAEGGLSDERRFGADGQREGRSMRRLAAGAKGAYADARIREERGFFEHGQAVGLWTFLDGYGAVLRTVDRGIAFRPEDVAASPAFAPRLEDGWATARELVEQGRVREAVCAAARAAARTGDRQALVEVLSRHTVALPPDLALDRGEALAQSAEADVAAILDGLVVGADASSALRALSKVLPATGPAAAELVDAALLLAPDRPMTHLTRALLRIQRGDHAGAWTDVAVVEAALPEAADSLATYARVVFHEFDAWPISEPIAGNSDGEDGASVSIAQSVEAIRRVAGVYATRISRVRDALRSFVGQSIESVSPQRAWFPPDLGALLPGGPVHLQREGIACEDGTIEIDEAIPTDDLGVPALLALAQADYVALCWLCWSTGLGRVGLPESIQPPNTLTAAIRTIVVRHWRAQDRLNSRGLLALTRGVPGFEWQGMDIDSIPPHIVPKVAGEYLAARSMFFWLVSPDAQSPFQDNLREG